MEEPQGLKIPSYEAVAVIVRSRIKVEPETSCIKVDSPRPQRNIITCWKGELVISFSLSLSLITVV